MTEPTDWNATIIKEFRANEGRVGGQFEGAPLLLLHSTGARSGMERVNPMMYQAVGDAYAVFASKGGAPSNPDWYHNLIANPDATIEVGTHTVPVRARIANDVERDTISGRRRSSATQDSPTTRRTQPGRSQSSSSNPSVDQVGSVHPARSSSRHLPKPRSRGADPGHPDRGASCAALAAREIGT